MKYLSIDTETTGLKSKHHSVIEIGIIECELGKVPTRALKILVVHDDMNVNLFCCNLHKDLWVELLEAQTTLGDEISFKLPDEHVDTLVIDSYVARHQAVADIIKGWLGYTKLTVAGKNVQFDIDFLNRLPHFEKTFKIVPRKLDPAMYYLKAGDERPPDAFTCIERSGLEIEYPHRAIEDALVVQKLIEHGSRNQRAAS